jgi:hypothetical protein
VRAHEFDLVTARRPAHSGNQHAESRIRIVGAKRRQARRRIPGGKMQDRAHAIDAAREPRPGPTEHDAAGALREESACSQVRAVPHDEGIGARAQALFMIDLESESAVRAALDQQRERLPGADSGRSGFWQHVGVRVARRELELLERAPAHLECQLMRDRRLAVARDLQRGNEGLRVRFDPGRRRSRNRRNQRHESRRQPMSYLGAHCRNDAYPKSPGTGKILPNVGSRPRSALF